MYVFGVCGGCAVRLHVGAGTVHLMTTACAIGFLTSGSMAPPAGCTPLPTVWLLVHVCMCAWIILLLVLTCTGCGSYHRVRYSVYEYTFLVH